MAGSFLSGNIQTNVQTAVAKTADYTITVGDILSGKVFVADTSSGDVTFTLPLLSTLPGDGILRSFAVGHSTGSNDVKLATNANDHFVYATTNKNFNLGNGLFHFSIAGVYNGSSGRWGFQSSTTIKASGHRDSNWGADQFSSETIIPFDSEAYNNNSELIVYTSGDNSRYTVKTSGSYKISYFINLDSTGGGTWNATAKLYKNGVALDPSEVRTGNYGGEDQTMACVPFFVDLAANDYIEFKIDQNSLTGNLIHAVFNIELRL